MTSKTIKMTADEVWDLGEVDSILEDVYKQCELGYKVFKFEDKLYSIGYEYHEMEGTIFTGQYFGVQSGSDIVELHEVTKTVKEVVTYV